MKNHIESDQCTLRYSNPFSIKEYQLAYNKLIEGFLNHVSGTEFDKNDMYRYGKVYYGNLNQIEKEYGISFLSRTHDEMSIADLAKQEKIKVIDEKSTTEMPMPLRFINCAPCDLTNILFVQARIMSIARLISAPHLEKFTNIEIFLKARTNYKEKNLRMRLKVGLIA